MEYNIITFGNGEILKGVFDAIAICLNSHSGTLYIPLIRLSMIIGGLWVALYAIYGDYMRAINGWIVPMTAIMQLFFVPQASVWILDPVSRYHQKVDHVPYGLAIVASKISTIGHAITTQVEKVFVLPDDLKYQKTGTIFASNLLQQAKTFRITNEELAENMRQFVGQCVTYDALLGRKYTIEDLRHSDDLWTLVSSNASPIRSFVWKDLKQEGQIGRYSIITCREGVAKFNAGWNGELTKTATVFGKKIFGKNSYVDPKAELLKYLPLAYETLTSMSKSAQDILKQNMMIYAIVDGIEQKATSLGNAPNFAVRRAYLQQRSNYETLGLMAAETLPTMKSVLEALAYATFLFVIPLSILPFGWTILKNWAGILLWLQAWAPLYAILNYIMTMAARVKSISALSVSNELGVTIASSVGLSNVNADIAAMTGYLAMSIPFLCIAIVKGIGSLVSVSSGFTNITQGVASQAVTESVTGNYSFGNISEGNVQSTNTNMLQHSLAANYRQGSFSQSDGRSDITTTASGQKILNIASSNLPVALNVAETQSAQLSEQANRSYQKGIQQSESYASNMADTLRQGVELSDHIANSKQSSDYYGDSKSIEQTTAINKSAQIVKEFAKDNNLTTNQAAQVLAAANANIGIKKGINMLASFKVTGNLGTSITGSAEKQDIYRKAERVAQSEDFQTSLRETSNVSHNQSFSKHDDEGQRLANSMAKSWDQANSFRIDAAKSFNQSEAYNSQAAAIKNSATTINANYNQQFVEWLANQEADNSGGGHIGAQGAMYIMAHNQDLTFNYAQRFLTEKNLVPKDHVDLTNLSPDNLRTNYNQENGHAFISVNKADSDNAMKALKEQAKQQGLTGVNDNNLKEKFNQEHNKAEQQFSVVQQNATAEYKNKELQHKAQSKKNLTGQAIKSQFMHVFDLLPDKVKNIFSEEK